VKKIKFPEDELAHNKIIEWWYFNGHLKDQKGNSYAFMNCLFKADVKKVKIPFLNKHPFKTIYFSHSILSDIKANKSFPKINYFSLVSKDSFSKPLLFVNYINPLIVRGYVNKVIEKTTKSGYHIKTEDFDLDLHSIKKPLLENGRGYVDLKSKGSYYYSLSNLKTKGVIRINGKKIKVWGKAWMDHQWANTSYSAKDKWTWFSIQLDNNIEMVCFEFDDGKNKTYLATVSYKNNKQVSATDVNLTQIGGFWKSNVTKAKYPLSWKIDIPSLKISLNTKPLLKKQEVLFGTINYWESPLSVKGSINNKKIKGVGFMELVGYPAGRSYTKIYKNKIKKQIDHSIIHIKNKVFAILR